MVRALGAVIALAAVAVIVAVTLGAFGPTTPAPSGPPRTTATATTRATAAASGTKTVTITFTEQDLTTAAKQFMPMTVSGITVSDPVVRLDAGRLTLTATGRAFILSGPVVVVASPVVTDGSASAKIESATFAGVALPDSTKQDIADTFTRTLRSNIPAGVRVTSMTVSTGRLVVQAAPG